MSGHTRLKLAENTAAEVTILDTRVVVAKELLHVKSTYCFQSQTGQKVTHHRCNSHGPSCIYTNFHSNAT